MSDTYKHIDALSQKHEISVEIRCETYTVYITKLMNENDVACMRALAPHTKPKIPYAVGSVWVFQVTWDPYRDEAHVHVMSQEDYQHELNILAVGFQGALIALAEARHDPNMRTTVTTIQRVKS